METEHRAPDTSSPGKLWIDSPSILYKEFSLIPSPNRTLIQNLNVLTILAVIIAIVLVFLRVPLYIVLTGLIITLVIIVAVGKSVTVEGFQHPQEMKAVVAAREKDKREGRGEGDKEGVEVTRIDSVLGQDKTPRKESRAVEQQVDRTPVEALFPPQAPSICTSAPCAEFELLCDPPEIAPVPVVHVPSTYIYHTRTNNLTPAEAVHLRQNGEDIYTLTNAMWTERGILNGVEMDNTFRAALERKRHTNPWLNTPTFC